MKLTKQKTKQTRMDNLLNSLKIDNTLTKQIIYKFPKIKQNIFPKKNYNYQADVLMLPESKEGYRYLLAMVDLWSNYFDIEPTKNKQADTMLQAMKEIFKRDIIKKPNASIRTDEGTEFKNTFTKYLYDNSILHLKSLPDRHKQMGNVERLNRDLGQLFMSYLTDQTNKLGYDYNEWIDIVDVVRKELNKIKTHPKDLDPRLHIPQDISIKKPKYTIGDMVYRRLEVPKDRFGNKYMNGKFRAGDSRFELNEPREIVDILAYKNSWRYLLNGFFNASYDEAELMKAKEKEEKYVILKIIDKKKVKNVTYYLVWWKRYNKGQSTWEPKSNLIEDGAQEYITEYEDSIK